MKNKFKNSFLKSYKIIFGGIFLLLISLFFLFNRNLKASGEEYEIYFHSDEFLSYSLFYDEGEKIEEIPELESYFIFVGWYDNPSYDGVNYYGKTVDEQTPIDLYAAIYYKDPTLDNLEVIPYLGGYEIVSYTGPAEETTLYIPSYYYEETETEDLYEIKDILSINETTFMENNNLMYITVPETVINIDEGTFLYLDDLMGIYVYSDNEYYSSDSYGVLLNKDETEILHFPANFYYETYLVPESVEIIKTETFLNNANLKKVIIGSNVLTIETEAFKNNINLETVIINDGLLESVEAKAFKNNNNLSTVMIPSTVTYVGSEAFSGSSASLDIYYQDKVSNIPLTWESDWNLNNYNVIGEYDLLTFTVTYLNDDDSVIDTEVVSFNQSAIKEITPTKESDLEYSYYFAYFEGASLTNIVSDITVKAVFYQEIRYYTVIFHDALGEVYGTMSFPYGENEDNNYWYTDVKKDPDLEYTYYFESWDVDLTFISSDLDVYPVFRRELNYYSIIFYFDDNDNQFRFFSVPYNTYVEAPEENPTKESTEVYNYVFEGWYLDIDKTIPFTDGEIEGHLNIYPKFVEELRTYKVEFYNNNSLYDIQDVVYGGSATVPVEPTRASTDKYHYEFMSWSEDFSNIVSYLRVDAVYDEILRSYTVKFYNEEVIFDEQVVFYDEAAVSPDDPTKDNTLEYTYTFAGWDKDYSKIRSDLNVYAIYTKIANVYLVSYETFGGTIITAHNQTYNTYIEEPTNPIKTGYTFGGWFSDSNYDVEWSFNTLMPAGDLTLYAKWDINSYTITFNSLGGSDVLSIIKEYNEAISEPEEPERVGYSFSGWFVEEDLISLFHFENMPASNITLYAGWEINSYKVTFNSLGGSLIEPVDVLYDSLINEPEEPLKEGYAFVGWYLEEALINEWNFSYNNMPAGDLTLYAGWDVNTYTVTFNSLGGSYVLPLSAFFNAAITEPEQPTKRGYTFNGWYTEEALINLYLFESMPAGDFTLYAKWDINSYTITFNSLGGSDVLSIIKEYNSEINEPDEPERVGYSFSGWYTEEALINLYLFESMPAVDFTLYAKWDINSYTITFNSLGGSDVLSIIKEYNSEINEPEEPLKEGYSFAGWFVEETLINLYLFEFMPAGDFTLYAKWDINSYTITFNSLGGSDVLSIIKEYNEAISEPEEPERVGYSFSGWFVEEDLISLFHFENMPASNITLYAGWDVNTYTVTFNSLGGSLIEPVDVLYDSLIAEPEEPLKEGYTFVGWYLEEALINEWNFSYNNMPAGDLTLYAGWDVNTYTVTFNSLGGSYVLPLSAFFNAAITEPEQPTKRGYTFNGWYTEEALINLYLFESMPAGDFTLYAKWDINSYTITFNSLGGSDVLSIIKEYNSEINEPDEPERVGYSFSGWYTEEALINLYLFESMPAVDFTLYAKWDINSYTITFNSLGGSDVLSIIKEYNSEINEPEEPLKEGYSFAGWFVEETLINLYLFEFMPAGDFTLYAKWDINSYTITFNSLGGSDVLSIIKEYNEAISEPEEPERVGYSFSGWFVEEDLISLFHFENMPASNITLYAGWDVNTYTVTFNSLGGSLIEPVDVLYDSLIAEPEEPLKEGYTFVGWYLEEALINEWNFSYNNMPAGDLTLYAKYYLNSYKVTFISNGGSYVLPLNAFFNAAITEPEQPTKRGYTFNGWYTEEALINLYLFESMPAGDFTLYAKWDINSYTITFNSLGGSDVLSIIKEYNSEINEPDEPERVGYSFSGWYTEEALINLYLFESMPAGDFTLYAKWDINSYTITFNSLGGSDVLSIIKEYNSEINEPEEPLKEGYSFAGWFVEETLINLYLFESMPAVDLTLYAKWIINSYQVTFYKTEEGITPKVIFEILNVTYGSDVNLEALSGVPTKSSTAAYLYEFVSWNGNLLNVIENRVIYPVYDEVLREYTVSFYSDDLLVNEQKVYYGESAVAPLDPFKEANVQYSYEFIGWDKEYNNIINDLIVYALFSQTLNQYSVKFYDEDESLIVERLVNYGSSANPPSNPVKESTAQFNYIFAGWSEDVSFISGDLMVYATYTETIREYTVKFYNENILLLTLSVEYGKPAIKPENPEKTSTPEYSYIFTGWSEDFSFISGDLTVYAVYEEVFNSYYIYYEVNGGSIIEPDVYSYNSLISAPDEPTKVGYSFNGWYIDSGLLSKYVFTIMPAGDFTLYAKWDKVNYQISYENTFGVKNLNPLTYNIETETIVLTNLSDRETHSFVGFYDDLTEGNLIKEIEKGTTGDITLYARWEIKSYTVSFYDYDESFLASLTVNHGSSATILETPERTGYTFTGWDKDVSNIVKDLVVTATYQVNSYQVSFSSLGVIINAIDVNYNGLINKPENPLKTGHSFVGWYTEVDMINLWDFETDLMKAEDMTLYASFKLNSYKITFNSSGGSILEPLIAEYGENIIEPSSPTKTGHTFNGWYTETTLINRYTFEFMPANNITLYAGWLINTYTVMFYNDDSTYLSEVIVNHGSNAPFEVPEKDSTAQYAYQFNGWSESVNNVLEDLTVYATYQEILRSYTITFYSRESGFIGNNPILRTDILTYGTTITPPESPIKESSVEFSYLFSHWDQEFSVVFGNLEIYPVFTETLRKYTITFFDDDYSTILKEEKVNYGESATAPEDPEKASTARYDFNFVGWDKDFSNIVGNLNVYATYERIIRSYTVNFYNELVLLKTVTVEYGASAVAPPAPTKAATQEFTYRFAGWSEDLSFVGSDLDVYAVFEEKEREYTVYFYDDERGYLLGNVVVTYGKEAIPPFIPEKESTDQYDYEFIGWSEDLSFITESMQTYAIYNEVLKDYLVTFVVYDSVLGEIVLKAETVTYGESATSPENPTKTETEMYTYVFTGWNLDYTFVDGNMKIYANFLEILKEFKVSFYSENELYKEVFTPYGTKVILPEDPTKEPVDEFEYTFVGWYLDSELTLEFDLETPITSELSLHAKYLKGPRNYTVKFYNENRLFNEQSVVHGESAIILEEPTKTSTEYYRYEFIGWSEDYTDVKSDLILVALYEEILREYKVYFYDGLTLIDLITVFAGESPAIEDPIKEQTAQYYFEFIGWDKDFSNITSDLTVNAVFEEILREYTVYFYNDLGEIIKKETVFYGSGATAPEAPIKESTEKYLYLFTGWNTGFMYVYGDLDVYPKYNEVIKTFTVNFYNEEIFLTTFVVEYGQSVIAPIDPVKEETEKYNYHFTGWSEELDNITHDLDVFAVFEEVIKTFKVVFYNDDGLVKISEQYVTYGMAAVAPEAPDKESSHQYDYYFYGWSDEFDNITSHINIYALYEETLRSFIINFYVLDLLVESLIVEYGTSVTIDIVPIKEQTEKYFYLFTGWSEDLSYIYTDLEVFAIFEEVIKTFTVTFYNDIEGLLVLKQQTVNYGDSATAPKDPTKDPTAKIAYEFTGWNKEFSEVKEDLNVYAEFEEVPRKYSVKFYNDDNTLLKEELVIYDENATAPSEPSKAQTAEFSYNFSGWDKDFTNIKEDLSVYATYQTVTNSYEVVFYDAENNIYKIEVLDYGTLITPPIGAVKESDKYNNYFFTKWDGFISGMTVTGEISFNPLYHEEVILYDIIIIVNKKEYKFKLPYLSDFPDVDTYIEDTNKYTYTATGAMTSEGEELDEIPLVVLDNLTLTIIYKAYIKVSYLQNYLQSINFNSIRSYQSLVEAHLMLEEVKEEDEDLLALFNLKIAEYNLLVEKTKEELDLVEEYENKIFKGMLKITLSLQILTYALYVQKRRWF